MQCQQFHRLFGTFFTSNSYTSHDIDQFTTAKKRLEELEQWTPDHILVGGVDGSEKVQSPSGEDRSAGVAKGFGRVGE